MTTNQTYKLPSEADWQWREYKAYVAMCGDYSECEIFMGKAVALVTVKWQVARHRTWAGQGKSEPDYLALEVG